MPGTSPNVWHRDLRRHSRWLRWRLALWSLPMSPAARRNCAFVVTAIILLVSVSSPRAASQVFKPLQNLAPAEALRPSASTFDVTSTGEAVWSMPLWAPPGRNRMEPHLALTYRSRGENGVVGLHFSIDGFLSIARCWSTPAQDGAYSKGAQPGLPDKFCLNGQRL